MRRYRIRYAGLRYYPEYRDGWFWKPFKRYILYGYSLTESYTNHAEALARIDRNKAARHPVSYEEVE
jgi:hypothetical protein